MSSLLEDPALGENPHWRARVMSYYGLSLALSRGVSHEAVQACEQALEIDDIHSEMYYNLARVYVLASKRTRAMAIVEAGVRIDPESKRLAQLRNRIDRRRPPVLERLGRDHPINRSLGRLRATLVRKGA